MKIDENFVELILHDFTLNKKQCEILDLPFPLTEGWDSLVLEKEITVTDTNLLILLKGKLALKTQDQIVKNSQSLEIQKLQILQKKKHRLPKVLNQKICKV